MKRKTALRISKISFHVTFVLFALAATASPMLLDYSGMINTVFNIQTSTGSGSDGNTYFDTEFETMDEVKEASKQIIDETLKEGAVLLKNDNEALPLASEDTVNLYGAASYWSVVTGMGSSSFKVNGDQDPFADIVTLESGLTSAGLKVNEDLNTWYKDNGLNYLGGSDHFIGYEDQEVQTVVKDAPWSALPSAKENDAKAGIMVLARNSGEAVDLYADITMDDGATRTIVSKKNNGNPNGSVGDALSLTDNEKDVLANMKKMKDEGKLDKIIVLMNCASPFQSAFVDQEEYGIDAAIWVGTLGTNGANAVGKLLTGKYNFSGRTADTFFADNKYNPVYYNFGSYEYGNSSALKSNYFATLGEQNHKFYVAYQEGIYNGYKYTETRYEDVLTNRNNAGSFDYEAAVSYPFGYGLSYSEFSYSNFKVTENTEEDTYTLTVDVTNNSKVDGKEVVQAYIQKPYTAKDIENGVEKSAVELAGFTKVDVKAGETVPATIEIKGKYLAAYDANGEKTYVIGSSDKDDEYLFTVAKDAHDAENNFLQYKADKGVDVDLENITTNDKRGEGDKELVWGKHIDYSATKYSTNEYIEQQNENFEARYDGEEANYGVSSITNQFDDTDYQKVGLFSDSEESQPYMSRNNWTGTYGKVIKLTASADLAAAQAVPAVEQDNISYPTYDEIGFYEGDDMFDEIKLIYLRGKDFNDPDWDTLLNRISWEETCYILQDALRYTRGIDSIAAPMTSQQNGAISPVHSRNDGAIPSQNAFRGFAELRNDGVNTKPTIFANNGIVAATYNVDLIRRIGKQTGEEAIWAGYNGIYGLGVNIHRGSYCGRTFEYYSEDGFLTGVAAGYEAAGLHDMGVFVLAKHAVLNDQETHRAGLNVWANEQSIREIYCRALEVAIDLDRELAFDKNGNRTHMPMLGVMTGMNRLGAVWTGGQGFLNTVLRAEFGMTSYAISDYNSSRRYMSPIQGVLYGNDLPDGNTGSWSGGNDYDGNSAQFEDYATGYGKLAWAMRDCVKNVLYTVVNSNAMNGITGDSSFTTITPLWEKLVPVVNRVLFTLVVWSTVMFGAIYIYDCAKQIQESLSLRK